MALTRKRSRCITVDGIAYRWMLRGRPTYDQALGRSPLTYAVEHAESPGATLVVITNSHHPSNWFNSTEAPGAPGSALGAAPSHQASGLSYEGGNQNQGDREHQHSEEIH